MKTATVTGGTGFIGAYVVDALLAQGVEVRCLVRPTSSTDKIHREGVEFVYGDVTNSTSLTDAVRGVDAVFHLAGLISSPGRSEFMRINRDGTDNVTSACAAMASPPLLIFVSSIAAAGPAIDGRPRRETDACHPVSDYGRSKRAGELAVAQHADRVPATIIRPPFVFGGGDDYGLHLFSPISRYGIHMVPGMRHGRRISVVHAADLAAAMLLAAEHGSRLDATDGACEQFRQGCYFVSCDEQPRYSDFGDMIGRALGRRRVVKVPSPDAVTLLLGAASSGVARLRRRTAAFSFDKAREAAAGSWTCSPEKIEQELGFKAAATLDDRLQETVNWYRCNGWL